MASSANTFDADTDFTIYYLSECKSVKCGSYFWEPQICVYNLPVSKLSQWRNTNPLHFEPVFICWNLEEK